MKIEKIKKMKNGKYKLEFSNGEKLSTYDDVILKNQLLFQKELDFSKFEHINQDTAYFDVYNKSLRKIAQKLRSEHEIKELLKKEELKEEEKNSILEKLKEVGFVNDLNYAKAYVSDKIYLSNEGPYKIRRGLEEHQINEEIIEEVISNIDENEINKKLKRLIEKRIQRNKKYSNFLLKQKIIAELSLQGYRKEAISTLFDTLKTETNVIDKEANRVYDRLRRKYEGIELERKTKEKLFQKGFGTAEINQFLEEKRNEKSD